MRGDDGKDGPKYMPIITNFEEPKFFRWRTKMMAEFLFVNDKVFELEETGSGTRLIHKDLFSGILMPLFLESSKPRRPINVTINERGLENNS